METVNYHFPVMLEESITCLNIKKDGIYVDGTLGMAGHSKEIAARLDGGSLIALDKDAFALEQGRERLSAYGNKVIFVHEDFRRIGTVLTDLGIRHVDGMIFDLGVSSPQLDQAERGFSYMKDAPLDMRMDQNASLSAYDVVNTWDYDRLTDILWNYGEERYAKRVANAIVSAREKRHIHTTLELAEIIRASLPAAALREKQHPAKRTFQAIRIAVNDELGAVSEMIRTAPDFLSDSGRLCVITFHSLEDRIVKQGINAREKGCVCPRGTPVCVCGFKQTLRSVTRKPICPSESELLINPRSRSAKLRVAEKIGES